MSSTSNKPNVNTSDKVIATFKIAIIGNSSVGKTSIVRRFINDNFSASTESTIGAQFCSKTVDVYPSLNDNTPVKVKLQIWDTAGEEKFRSVAPIYYKNTSAVAMIYDVTDIDSFRSLQKWYEEVEASYSNEGSEPILYAVVGNKSDMHSQQKVSI